MVREGLGPGGNGVGGRQSNGLLVAVVGPGASLFYNPDLVVIHPSPVPPYDAKSIRRTHAYNRGAARVLKKHELPLWFKAKLLIRPLGGAVLSLVGLKPREAKYRWSTFRGRLRELLS